MVRQGRRLACALFALAVLAGCSDAESPAAEQIQRASPAEPAEPALEARLGRCYASGCSWHRTQAQAIVLSDATGMLFRLTLLGGTSADGNDSDNPDIEWNDEPHTAWVFCSSRLPAVLVEAGGGIQVDLLDFVNGVPGALESSANLYSETCHPGEDWTSDTYAELHALPSLKGVGEVTVKRPQDIVEVAERLSDN